MIRGLFRVAHSRKGTAANLNIYSVAEAAHCLEDELAKCLEIKVIEVPGSLKGKFNRLEELTQNVLQESASLIGNEDKDSKKKRILGARKTLGA